MSFGGKPSLRLVCAGTTIRSKRSLDELRQRVQRRASPLDPRIHRHLEPSGAPLDRLQQRHRGLALVRPEPRPLVVVAVGCVVTSDPTGEAGALAGPTARNWER